MTICLTADETMTALLARVLAARARPGQTYLLDGPVGAGKTHFARAFIQARQGDEAEDVPSPTYTLVQTYDDPAGADGAGAQIWHSDLYRLTDPGELAELGLDEAMDPDASDAICLIEWPDRLPDPPRGAITLRLGPADDPDQRLITILGGGPDLARAVALAQFLHASGQGTAKVTVLAGDASSRDFLRVAGPAGALVSMDDPGGSSAAFAAMTGWLRGHGFAAPAILAQDVARGLLLVEDLGRDRVADLLATQPSQAGAVYARITDLLVDLHRCPPPDRLVALDGPLLAEQVGLFADWYPGAADLPGADRIGSVIASLHALLAADAAPVVALRDFHAENLIWRGDAPLGLIDYQDAVLCHPAYDLVSCLQDARRDVDPAIETACIARYLAATGADPDRFGAAYALLGAQRNLRIMGIFARLCLRDRKPRYLAFLPRVHAYLVRDLAHPALAPLAALLAPLPAPDAAALDGMADQCPR